MNYYQDELTAKYNRLKVRDEFKQDRLEQLATQSRLYRPGLFTKTMHSFSIWMISKGKELHNRYEIPTAHSHQTSSNSIKR